MTTPPARRQSWLERLALALPAVVMLVLGVWGLGRDDAMGNDEVATRWISSLSLPTMRHVLAHLDAVHGLYYVLIHFWMVFGRSPTAIRVPSVLAMVLAVGVVTVLAVRLTGRTRAGVAAGLVAASTTSITFYAQTARSYAMVYLVVGLATLVLVHALDRERVARPMLVALRPWLLYGLLVVLGAYLNELSLLVLGAHLITVLCARRGRAALARWSGVSVIAVLLVAPLIRLSRQQSTVLAYLRPPGGEDVWTLFHVLFGGTTVIAVLVAALAVAGVVVRIPSSDSETTAVGVSAATVGLPLLLVPAALLMLYSLIESPLYADRYVLFGEIGVAVLAGAGLESLVGRVRAGRLLALGHGGRSLATAAVLVACAAVFAGQFGAQQVARTPQSRQFNLGGPAAYLGARARPGDGVLFFGLFYRKTRLGYPADFRHTTDFAQSVSPARAATFRGLDLPFAKVRPLMLERNRIWVIGRPPGSPGSPGSAPGAVAGIRLQSRFLQRHYVKIEGRHFGRVSATLWRRV